MNNNFEENIWLNLRLFIEQENFISFRKLFINSKIYKNIQNLTNLLYIICTNEKIKFYKFVRNFLRYRKLKINNVNDINNNISIKNILCKILEFVACSGLTLMFNYMLIYERFTYHEIIEYGFYPALNNNKYKILEIIKNKHSEMVIHPRRKLEIIYMLLENDSLETFKWLIFSFPFKITKSLLENIYLISKPLIKSWIAFFFFQNNDRKAQNETESCLICFENKSVLSKCINEKCSEINLLCYSCSRKIQSCPFCRSKYN